MNCGADTGLGKAAPPKRPSLQGIWAVGGDLPEVEGELGSSETAVLGLAV